MSAPSSIAGIRVETAPAALPHAPRWTAIDVFFAANILLDLGVWAAVNYERYVVREVAPGRGLAFAVVALLLIGGIGCAWRFLRKFQLPLWLLGLGQVALLAHFAGPIVHVHGAPLVMLTLGGVRFDKLVHFLCAVTLAFLLDELAPHWQLPRTVFTRLLIALATLGVAGGVEIFEYVATLTMPRLDAARFEDSLLDLMADLAGAALFFLISTRRSERAADTAPTS